jgi:hypothetical protein
MADFGNTVLYYQGNSKDYRIFKRVLVYQEADSPFIGVYIQLKRPFVTGQKEVKKFQRRLAKREFLIRNNQEYLDPKDDTEDFVLGREELDLRYTRWRENSELWQTDYREPHTRELKLSGDLREEIETAVDPDPFLVFHPKVAFKKPLKLDLVYRRNGLMIRAQNSGESTYIKPRKIEGTTLHFKFRPAGELHSFSLSLLDSDGYSIDILAPSPEQARDLNLRAKRSPFLLPRNSLEKTNSRAARVLMQSLH